MTTYNYLLVRGEISDHAVPGMLFINGNYVCDTLETANCCLRAGTYKLAIESCEKTKSKLLRVQTPWQEQMQTIDPEDLPEGELSYCARCVAQKREHRLCYRRFYEKLEVAMAENLSQAELDAVEQTLEQTLQQDLHARAKQESGAELLPCPKITHGTGVKGLQGGTILLGTLPEPIELGDKRIQLPILKQSGEVYRHFLERIEKTYLRGDCATLTIRG